VTAPPGLELLPASVPRPLRLLLEALLNKNQSQRLQHIADMRLFLDQKLFPPAAAAAAGKNDGGTGQPDHTFGTPVTLFQTPLTINRNQSPRERRYDVAPDGRFLIATPVAAPGAPVIEAVINWASGLSGK
jgi:hypothetical protein